MRKPILFFLVMSLCISGLITNSANAQEVLANNKKRQLINYQSTSKQKVEAYHLKDVLHQVETQHGVTFFYDNQLIDSLFVAALPNKDAQVESKLSELLTPLKLSYKKLKGNNYVILTLRDLIKEEKERLETNVSPQSEQTQTTSVLSLLNTISNQQLFFVVSGKVTGSENEPIPGVNIIVKGSTVGTSTDVQGNYKLSLDDASANSSTLIFSFIGYETQEIPVNGRTEINVSLKNDLKTLEEVIVVGYGEVKKSDLTGSVGTVKSDQIQERQLASVNQALAGRIAGVSVNVNSGRPGGQTNVRIRGSSSINASNNPLYVIDGVILPVGTQTGNSNAIDFINPADIASMEVLKDASATAIYGARGANGVILITTKRGSTGGGKITYDMQMSVPTIGPHRVEMLNAQEFLDVEDLAWKNAAIYDPSQRDINGNFTGKVNPKLNRTDPLLFDANGSPLYDTDWLKVSTQNKLSQNHQLSFTGGNRESTFGAFIGYRDDNGLLLNSYLKRYSARFVFDSQIKSWIKIGGNLSYNFQDENLVDTGTGGLNSVRMITEALPFLPITYPDGTYSHNSHYATMEGGRNPVDQLLNNKYQLLTQTTIGNVYANIRLAKGLELRSTVGTNIVARERQEYTSRPPLQGVARTPLSAGDKGSALLRTDREAFWSFENYLTYNKRIADAHAITALLGLSWQETQMFGFQASTTTFQSDFFGDNNIGSGATINTPASGRSRFAFNSYFGRLNYSLKDKYLLTVTGRMDGSSKFGESNKYSFFPSAAVAWKASDEEFIKNITAISTLKLRASYGLTGNSEINAYSALAVLNAGYAAVFNNTRFTGIGKGRLGNPELQWEKTAQSDVGLELGLLSGKIYVEADLYHRKTTDMLLDAPLPNTSGYTTITKNVGSMENKGFEFAITTENFSSGSFSWTTTFNIAGNKNKVLSLATPAPIFGVGNPNFTNQTGIIRVGDPVGSFWGLVRLGTWSTDEAAEAAKFKDYRGGKPILPGDIKYLDVNGDHLINDDDRMIIGKAYPDVYGSFINTWKYKGFDLMLDLQYSYGNDVLNMTKHSGEDRVSIANSYSSVLKAWTPENQNSDIAAIRDTRAGYVTNVDTHWVEDGSFIRGRNLLLGYNFNSSVTERLRLERLRMYVSVQNFFLATKFSGNDPEVTTYGNVFAQGQTFFDYPKPTMYMFGLSIGL